ncbi:hypothetical protein ACHAWU_002192 [Discostella pseudostelligera]|uniref:Uncharacterized protein n=1 Tax=Discostella pseudostelligera TaxID=259834 RepID=A0ABD3MBH8_9STRA
MPSPHDGTNDQSLRRQQAGHLASPSSPSQAATSGSQLSTPIMSQQRAKTFLNTPPSFNDGGNGASVGIPFPNAKTTTSFPQQTPASMMPSQHYGMLEPPAWRPPEADEIEYTDAWNNTYNNQHHYLQPSSNRDDSSIGSNLTNNSLMNTSVICNSHMALRPRGYSCSLTTDAPSIGSCPQAHRVGGGGRISHHRRHPSLPVSIFSSTPHHHNMFSTEQNKRYLNALQPTTKNNPYELNTNFNQSQVQADGAKAGLVGTLLDLYMIDRMVDCASAKMLVTKNDHEDVDGATLPRKTNMGGSKQSSSRRTSLGTVYDIRCILELHKVDKIVDRFKLDLQMPQFFEDEAWEGSVWRDLRRTDVEIENMKLKATEDKKENEELPRREKPVLQFQYDEQSEDGGWEVDEGIGAGGGSAGSSYQFFDPHESDGLHAHSYHHSKVAASISDDLHDVIELLRTDFEVDGASRRHKELEMITPLLLIDQEMNKIRLRTESKDLWDTDLKALYLTDLEVDKAKERKSLESPLVNKGKDSLPLMESSEQLTNEEVKEILSQHIPQGPRKIFQTPRHVVAAKGTLPPADLALPPPVPLSSPQASTNFINSSTHEQANATLATAPTITKRSIFSSREKSSAASQCGFQLGVMAPGTTTTVVMAKGGETIDGIPIGKVVMR